MFARKACLQVLGDEMSFQSTEQDFFPLHPCKQDAIRIVSDIQILECAACIFGKFESSWELSVKPYKHFVKVGFCPLLNYNADAFEDDRRSEANAILFRFEF